MPDTLTIKTSGVAVLCEEKAKYFALSIFADMKAYIKEHRAEYWESCSTVAQTWKYRRWKIPQH